MVGSDQLISTMIGLTAPNSLLVADGARGQLLGPVHPVNACIYMVLIGSTNLKDVCNPFIIRLFAATFAITCSLLKIDGRLVGDRDKAPTIVFVAINCQELLISPLYFGRRRDSSNTYG